jgi:hypothetical protein
VPRPAEALHGLQLREVHRDRRGIRRGAVEWRLGFCHVLLPLPFLCFPFAWTACLAVSFLHTSSVLCSAQ